MRIFSKNLFEDLLWWGLMLLAGGAVMLLFQGDAMDWAFVAHLFAWSLVMIGAGAFLIIIIASIWQRLSGPDTPDLWPQREFPVLVTCRSCGHLFNPADPADTTDQYCLRCALDLQQINEAAERETREALEKQENTSTPSECSASSAVHDLRP